MVRRHWLAVVIVTILVSAYSAPVFANDPLTPFGARVLTRIAGNDIAVLPDGRVVVLELSHTVTELDAEGRVLNTNVARGDHLVVTADGGYDVQRGFDVQAADGWRYVGVNPGWNSASNMCSPGRVTVSHHGQLAGSAAFSCSSVLTSLVPSGGSSAFAVIGSILYRVTPGATLEFLLPGVDSPPDAAVDGFAYGSVSGGGTYGKGFIYRVSADTGPAEGMHHFGADPNEGFYPTQARLGPDGIVYGSTFAGGAFNHGTLFRLVGARTTETLFDFSLFDHWNRRFSVGTRGVYVVSDVLTLLSPAERRAPFGIAGDLLVYTGFGDLLFEKYEGLFVEQSSWQRPPRWTITTADFNGDGLRDMLHYDPATGQVTKMINVGNSRFTITVDTMWAPGWTITEAEFDGDGRSDLLLYNPATGQWFRCMSAGDGTGDFVYVTGMWARGWAITAVDWDADGRSDFFLYNPSTGQWVKVATLRDGSFGYPASGYWAKGWQVYAADFNAERRSDLFLYGPAGTPVAGRNFIVTSVGETFDYWEGPRWSPNWRVTVGDLDGDGRSDIFLYDPATGVWFTVFKDAGYEYLSGVWATDWTIAHTRMSDGTTVLVPYNANFGQWFRAVPQGRGGFSFTEGVWYAPWNFATNRPAGITVIPM
jgi:uncharacterized repeat protein (TIGR03803 family)